MSELLEKIGIKKIVSILVFIVILFVLIFGGAFLYNKYFFKKSYSDIEDLMKESAIKYFEVRQNKLPQNINESIDLDVNVLVNAEVMKDIGYYLKDEETSCKGKVIVTKISNGEFNVGNTKNDYLYTPVLKCGADQYNTVFFVDKFKTENPVVGSGNGLYKIGDELVFRGDSVNNYFKFSGKLYRIVKITKDDEIVLLYSDSKLDSVIWDDRYNAEKKSSFGINSYDVSRIKDSINSVYKSEVLVKNYRKQLVIAHNAEIGKRGKNDNDKSGNLEKAALYEKQYISLLPAYDYMNASLDNNCVTTESESCLNYNYMTIADYNWWTGTGSKDNTYQIYRVTKSLTLSNGFSNGYLRPVIHLSKYGVYLGGTGTHNDPYILK